MKNLYFRILTRPCFIHIGKTLTSNPELLNFTPAMPTIFANTANPVFIPVSIFHQTMVEELRGAGGQMWKGTNLSLTRTHTDIAPPNPYASWPITLLQKFIHAVGDHHRPRKNTRPLRTLRLWPTLMSEHCLAGEYFWFLLIRFFQKLEELKIFLAPSFAHFLPTLLSLQVAKFFQGKPKILPPIGFQKRWPCP